MYPKDNSTPFKKQVEQAKKKAMDNYDSHMLDLISFMNESKPTEGEKQLIKNYINN